MSDPKYDKKYLKTFGQAQENIQPLEENVTKRILKITKTFPTPCSSFKTVGRWNAMGPA